MILTSTFQIAIGGALGPFIPELIKLFMWRNNLRMVQQYGDWRYWGLFAFIVPVGALAATMYDLQQMPLHLALHLGATPAVLLGAVGSASVGRRRGLLAAPTHRLSLWDLLSWS